MSSGDEGELREGGEDAVEKTSVSRLCEGSIKFYILQMEDCNYIVTVHVLFILDLIKLGNFKNGFSTDVVLIIVYLIFPD